MRPTLFPIFAFSLDSNLVPLANLVPPTPNFGPSQTLAPVPKLTHLSSSKFDPTQGPKMGGDTHPSTPEVVHPSTPEWTTPLHSEGSPSTPGVVRLSTTGWTTHHSGVKGGGGGTLWCGVVDCSFRLLVQPLLSMEWRARVMKPNLHKDGTCPKCVILNTRHFGNVPFWACVILAICYFG